MEQRRRKQKNTKFERKEATTKKLKYVRSRILNNNEVEKKKAHSEIITISTTVELTYYNRYHTQSSKQYADKIPHL